MNLKDFDWRSLQRYLSPQAAYDLNDFLERLPQKAGNTVLIAAGISWAAAAMFGLYTTIQIQSLTEMRHELKEVTALKPMLPKIRNVPVSQEEVAALSSGMENMYPGLRIKRQGAAIYISAQSTASFGEFREAVGHVQNGGTGWRVSVDRLCVGRECPKEKLAALLKINKVDIKN